MPCFEVATFIGILAPESDQVTEVLGSHCTQFISKKNHYKNKGHFKKHPKEIQFQFKSTVEVDLSVSSAMVPR